MSLIILASLLNTHHLEVGKATVYSPRDSGLHLASCNGKDPKTGKSPCRRCFFSHQAHIAHRTLPLGTTGILCSLVTRLCVKTVVLDRGTWGAVTPCGRNVANSKGLNKPRKVYNKKGKCLFWWQTQIKLQKGWKRRSTFDLTEPVARSIGHRAFDKVVFIYGQGQDTD